MTSREDRDRREVLARAYAKSPSVRLATALGPVLATFGDAGQVAVWVEAHINDDAPALVYRGQDYIGMVHLWADAGPGLAPWSPRSGRAHDVSLSKRPQWTDAPPSHRDALVAAVADAVRAYVRDNPDVLRAAEFADASQRVSTLVEDHAKAVAAARELETELRHQQSRMDRNAPEADA